MTLIGTYDPVAKNWHICGNDHFHHYCRKNSKHDFLIKILKQFQVCYEISRVASSSGVERIFSSLLVQSKLKNRFGIEKSAIISISIQKNQH